MNLHHSYNLNNLRAAARVWARAGASGIVIAARSVDALNKVADELKAISPETKILAVKTDIISDSDVKNLFVQVQQTFGRHADVLLNNAGYISDGETIGDTPTEQWWKAIVRAPFQLNTYKSILSLCRKSTSKVPTA